MEGTASVVPFLVRELLENPILSAHFACGCARSLPSATMARCTSCYMRVPGVDRGKTPAGRAEVGAGVPAARAAPRAQIACGVFGRVPTCSHRSDEHTLSSPGGAVEGRGWRTPLLSARARRGRARRRRRSSERRGQRRGGHAATVHARNLYGNRKAYRCTGRGHPRFRARTAYKSDVGGSVRVGRSCGRT